MSVFVSVLVLWIVSLCLHEYAHARVAYAGGDTSVEEKGYLSMNPLRYVHPVTSIVIPIAILAIGGIPLPGGAVYIDHTRLRSRHWDAAVSLAGPMANLALLLGCGLAFGLGLLPDDPMDPIVQTFALFAYLQALAFVLNMLPVPGLDGFGCIAPYLPAEVRQRAYEMANIAFILVIVALFPAASPVKQPFFELVLDLTLKVGIPLEAIRDGFATFMSVTRW